MVQKEKNLREVDQGYLKEKEELEKRIQVLEEIKTKFEQESHDLLSLKTKKAKNKQKAKENSNKLTIKHIFFLFKNILNNIQVILSLSFIPFYK